MFWPAIWQGLRRNDFRVVDAARRSFTAIL
jgi:hypothetical protein